MPPRPAGTVTFLYTDVEGSTRLVEQLGGRYAELLADHARLLREAVQAHGGTEVDTQGDSFLFAFGRPDAALAAALDGQATVLSHAWSDDATVRVRMGIHTGAAAFEGGRYHGLALHRAARISSLAHGGQVVLSGVTRQLLDDGSVPEAELRDLGSHRLKDFDKPVRIFQASKPGLPSAFPPLRRQQGRSLRRRAVIVSAAIVVALAVGAAVLLTTRSGGIAVTANSLAVIDARTGKVRADVPLSGTPTFVAAANGSAWVSDLQGRVVYRIDEERSRVVATVGLSVLPTGVAVGPGRVSIVSGATVVMLDSFSSQVVATVHLPPPALDRLDPNAAILDTGKDIWVGNPLALFRLDAASRKVVAANGTLPGNPIGLAIGLSALWVIDSGGTVYRLDPHTAVLLGTTPLGSAQTRGIAPAGVEVAQGAVWATDSGASRIWQLDATGAAAGSIDVGRVPVALVSAGGYLWVADQNDGTVAQIDPRRATLVRMIRLGHNPVAIAADGGRVLVLLR